MTPFLSKETSKLYVYIHYICVYVYICTHTHTNGKVIYKEKKDQKTTTTTLKVVSEWQNYTLLLFAYLYCLVLLHCSPLYYFYYSALYQLSSSDGN